MCDVIEGREKKLWMIRKERTQNGGIIITMDLLST